MEGFWLVVAAGAKMRQKPAPSGTAGQHAREIRRGTRKRYPAEKKIRIVLSGLRGEHSVAELCRRKGIAAAGALPFWPAQFALTLSDAEEVAIQAFVGRYQILSGIRPYFARFVHDVP